MKAGTAGSIAREGYRRNAECHREGAASQEAAAAQCSRSPADSKFNLPVVTSCRVERIQMAVLPSSAQKCCGTLPCAATAADSIRLPPASQQLPNNGARRWQPWLPPTPSVCVYRWCSFKRPASRGRCLQTFRNGEPHSPRRIAFRRPISPSLPDSMVAGRSPRGDREDGSGINLPRRWGMASSTLRRGW